LKEWVREFAAGDRVQEKFQRLKAEWLSGIGSTSSMTDMILHTAYQQIIGIGPAAIPLLLRELEAEPQHWFWALTAITSQNPAADAKTVDDAARAWLQWGRQQSHFEHESP
jgi:hypothetical protein